MSLDLVAVQRDSALLDALSQRLRLDGMGHEEDPVVGLLAALALSVDDELPASDLPMPIPEQSRRAPGRAHVLALTVAAAPVRRRHAARAVAALAVAAAVLSISGVAAAVSGDPLTPYKSVINVVRGEYHDVAPAHGLRMPASKVATPKAVRAAAKAKRVAVDARQDVSSRASRNGWRAADGRRFWDRHARHRQASHHRAWKRHWSDRRAWERGRWVRGASWRGRHPWGGSQQAGWQGNGGAGNGGAGNGAGREASDSGGSGDSSDSGDAGDSGDSSDPGDSSHSGNSSDSGARGDG
jgi:hypothetical protein